MTLRIRKPLDIVLVNSPFGYRAFGDNKRFHAGIDLAPKVKGVDGDEVYAVGDGIVRAAKIDPNGYGMYLIIEHAGYCSLYAHLRSRNFNLGDSVKEGAIIGEMGNSGGSTGTHLHFEIRECAFSDFWKKTNLIGKLSRPLYAVDPLSRIL